jgi:hypothetical protein
MILIAKTDCDAALAISQSEDYTLLFTVGSVNAENPFT